MSLSASSLESSIKDALGKNDVIDTMSVADDGSLSTSTKQIITADIDTLIKVIAEKVVEHIKDNMDIYVPGGAVITKVVGQAVGTPNIPGQVKCTIDLPS